MGDLGVGRRKYFGECCVGAGGCDSQGRVWDLSDVYEMILGGGDVVGIQRRGNPSMLILGQSSFCLTYLYLHFLSLNRRSYVVTGPHFLLVFEALKRWRKNNTTIIITPHR
jgi:hypothetical protein